MQEQKHSTRFINQNFLIHVYGNDGTDTRVNKLVGVRGLTELIGEELKEKFITRALNNRDGDKTRCCLRRGLVVVLYNK